MEDYDRGSDSPPCISSSEGAWGRKSAQGAWPGFPSMACHRFVEPGGWGRNGAFWLAGSIIIGSIPWSVIRWYRLRAKVRGVGVTGPVGSSRKVRSSVLGSSGDTKVVPCSRFRPHRLRTRSLTSPPVESKLRIAGSDKHQPHAQGAGKRRRIIKMPGGESPRAAIAIVRWVAIVPTAIRAK